MKKICDIYIQPHPLFDKGKGGYIIGTATGRKYDSFSELIANEPITMIKYPKRKEVKL